MRRLVWQFWDEAMNVCHASDKYGMACSSQRPQSAVDLYPKSADVLEEECSMHTIKDYIFKRRNMLAAYLVEHSIFHDCIESQRKGLVPQQWWWEQQMCLGASDATGSSN